jgi:hypothetical protein
MAVLNADGVQLTNFPIWQVQWAKFQCPSGSSATGTHFACPVIPMC